MGPGPRQKPTWCWKRRGGGGGLKTLLSAVGGEEGRCLCSGAWQGDRRPPPPPLQERLGDLQPADLSAPDLRAVTGLICAPVMKNLCCP